MKYQAIDWPIIVEQLQSLCTAESVKIKVDDLQAFNNPQEVKAEFQKVGDFLALMAEHPRPSMESLDLVSGWMRRLEKKAQLKPIEIKDIRHFCIEVLALFEILDNANSDTAEKFLSEIFDPEESLSAIDQIINPDGSIRVDASEKLYSLYNEKNNLNKSISNTLDSLVKTHDLEHIIQDKYVTTREGRRVIPIKSNLQSQMEGIIHASSHSQKTVFMEPQEVVPMNNRVKQIETEIEEEIEALLKYLSDYFYRLKDEFEMAIQTLESCDLLYAKAHLAQMLDANPCDFSDSEFYLSEVRHPGLVLQNEKVVDNTLTLDSDKRILLLTGPNAGGKTVLLKSIGLAALMAKHGLFICAGATSKVPFVNNFFVAVGDLQSVDENLSTFAGHLKVLNEALAAKGPGDLILIDEICGSTDPEEGSALAKSFITDYLDHKSFAIVTSHLSPLKSGWEDDCGLVNGSLEYNQVTGKPTYQFLLGVAGESQAIETAKRAGVSKHILERALDLLSPDRKEQLKKMDEVESLRENLVSLRRQLDKQMKKADQERIKYEKLVADFEEEKSKALSDEVEKAQEQISTMIEHAKVKDTFKKHETLQQVKTKIPQVIKSKGNSEGGRAVTDEEEFKKLFPPGSKVYVESIGRDGVVQSQPNARGEVEVLSQSMRLNVQWNSLKSPKVIQNNTQRIISESKRNVSYTPADSDRIVDLRGLSVEEALDQLELQLDTAAVQQEDRVKVVHGHGTDALKRSVRQYLSRSVYVKKWQAGNKYTGGDGVTWIEIN